MASDGSYLARSSKQFKLKNKMSNAEKTELRSSRTNLKYIEIGDVTRYELITKYIVGTIDELPTRGEFRIRKGNILMSINNSSRGTVVYVPDEFDGAVCTSGFLVIEPENEDEGHLLWYALRSEFCRKQIYYLAQTASQPELKLPAWEADFVVPMPAGENRVNAIQSSKEFQSHLSALLNADSYRVISE